MSNKQTTISKDAANKKLIVVREFDAPLEEVWKAWTEQDLLDQWWAPKPWKAKTKTMDFREGGHWLYCMMMPPESEKNWGRQNYQKIVLHENFSGTDVFCDENGVANPEFPTGRFENVFSEANEKTLVTVISTHNNFEEIEMVIEMGFKEGLASAFENLDKYLKSLK